MLGTLEEEVGHLGEDPKKELEELVEEVVEEPLLLLLRQLEDEVKNITENLFKIDVIINI